MTSVFYFRLFTEDSDEFLVLVLVCRVLEYRAAGQVVFKVEIYSTTKSINIEN